MQRIREAIIALLLCLGASVPVHAAEVGDFAFVQGVWNVDVQFQNENGEWGEAARDQATGQSIMGGSMYELDMVMPFPGAAFSMRVTLAYDRFNKLYRAVVFDDINGFMDFYNGQKVEDGSIELDNLQTTTGFPDGKGGEVFGRLRMSKQENGMVFFADISSGEGADWAPYAKLTFTPRN